MTERKAKPHEEYFWYSPTWPECDLCPPMWRCACGNNFYRDRPHCPNCGEWVIEQRPRSDDRLAVLDNFPRQNPMIQPHPRPATHDARILNGRWAYVCDYHFDEQMCKVGLYRGQRLVDMRGQGSDSQRRGG